MQFLNKNLFLIIYTEGHYIKISAAMVHELPKGCLAKPKG